MRYQLLLHEYCPGEFKILIVVVSQMCSQDQCAASSWASFFSGFCGRNIPLNRADHYTWTTSPERSLLAFYRLHHTYRVLEGASPHNIVPLHLRHSPKSEILLPSGSVFPSISNYETMSSDALRPEWLAVSGLLSMVLTTI